MAEKSFWWTTGGAGDGASTYTRADLSDVVRIVNACLSFEGVGPEYLNDLAGSVPAANTVRIATGCATVDGKPYHNTANVDVNIPSAVGGGNTRIDRVVLRGDWTAQTVRIFRIAGIDASSPVPPAITQTPGTLYDIMLYQALVDTGGTVAITDERVFAAITADSIKSRTRQFIVNASATHDPYAGGGFPSGYKMEDGVASHYHGYIAVPSDFASGLTLKFLIHSPATSGNVYRAANIYVGALDSSHNLTGYTLPYTAAAYSGPNIIRSIYTLPNLAVSPGSLLGFNFSRDAAHVSDTLSNYLIFLGVLVSYTADS